jgi:CO/xanthine dehydrogenase Mo-binding subunit
MINYKDVVRNVMAREKALYEGHPVAAVAATSAEIAKQALKLIKVDYEVLPHVIDVVEAMQPGAPLLHDDMFTAGVDPAPKTPSNVAKRVDSCWATSPPASSRPTSSSSARSRPSPCTRATSSRTPAWRACRRTARPTCG